MQRAAQQKWTFNRKRLEQPVLVLKSPVLQLQALHHHAAVLRMASASADDCCGSDSGEEDRLPLTESLSAQFSKSWLVSGMDCPACARK